MKRGIWFLVLALAAILLGLVAIVKIIKITEIVVGALSLTFGITAIIWAAKARNSLSVGSELRNYSNIFLASLLSIVAFSISDILLYVFQFEKAAMYFYYLKYLLITASYFVFLVASYKILSIGQTFGFNYTADDIKKIMDQKAKAKKKSAKK